MDTVITFQLHLLMSNDTVTCLILFVVYLCVTWSSYLTWLVSVSSAIRATTKGEETEITNLVAGLGLRVPRQRRPNPQYAGPEWIA